MDDIDITFQDFINHTDSFLQIEKDWLPLYYHVENDSEYFGIRNALIVNESIDKYLETTSWGHREIASWSGNIFDWKITYSEDSEEDVTEWDYSEKLKPLLYFKHFGPYHEKQLDIIEEFKVYFNLFQDESNNFYHQDINDSDILAIKNDNGNFYILNELLEKYLYLTSQSYILTFTYNRKGKKTIEELGLEETRKDHFIKDRNLSFFQYYGPSPSGDSKSYGTIEGKKVIYGKSSKLTLKEKLLNSKNRLSWFRRQELKTLYSNFNDYWHSIYKFKLFDEINPKENFLFTSLRIPDDSYEELDIQMGYLAKIFNEYMNIEAINENLSEHVDEATLKECEGGLNRLELLIDKVHLDDKNNLKNLIEIFREIQKYRSSGGSHRKGEKFDKLIIKIPELKSNKQSVYFKNLIDRLNVAFKQVLPQPKDTQSDYAKQMEELKSQLRDILGISDTEYEELLYLI